MRLVLVLLGFGGALAAAPRLLAAQCPDGSPPPCSRGGMRPTPPAANSVAVLYFEARDTADAYLADGLTEELIVRLGQVPRIRVKSRYESQRLRVRAGLDPAALGRALNAVYLVSGTVQRRGDRVRVRVELDRAATRDRVWGDAFDRTGGDVLAIEQEIALAVVQGIVGQLLPEEQARLARRGTRDPRAHDLYLRGKFYLDRFSREDLRLAITFFEQAIAIDSSYAEPFAGIAFAWVGLADDSVSSIEGETHAREAAERAIALDSASAVALLGAVSPTVTLDRDFDRADRLLLRALALDSSSADTYSLLCDLRLNQGRVDEALAAARRAWQLDSFSTHVKVTLDAALYYARRYDETIALGEADDIVWANLARIRLGRCEEALRRLDAQDLMDRVAALACAGRIAEAREALERWRAKLAATRDYYPADFVARALIAVGDDDEAFRLLDRADVERSGYVTYLLVDPAFDAVRQDPRFAALVRRMGLPQKN